MRVDTRWIHKDGSIEFFTARVWTPGSILLRVPSFPFTALNQRDAIEIAGVTQQVVNGMDTARHNYLKGTNLSEDQKWKQLLLQFPADHELLSITIYSDAKEQEELDFGVLHVTLSPDGG